MFENDAKGWHGSYSVAGRASAEQYKSLVNKDKLLLNKTSHIKEPFTFKNIFTPNKTQHITYIEDKLDAFKVYTKQTAFANILHALALDEKHTKQRKQHLTNDRYKYYNKHIKEGRKRKEAIPPACTKYNPNHTFIWSRVITGPKWNSIPGRETKQIVIDNKDFFVKEDPIESRNKCFVNMNRQTQRGDSLHGRDVRIRTDTTFHKKDIDNLSTMHTYSTSRNNNLQDNFDRTISHLDGDRNKLISDNKDDNKQKQYIKAPNFSKTISREQVDKVKNPKNATPYFKDPKYSLTQERVLTISTFNQPRTKPRAVKTMEGIDPGFRYHPDKVISNINNHKKPKTLKFELMASMPENEKLPSFMVNLFNRHGANFITNQTLKMNNYKNSSFQKTLNSGFFPKKSFNRFVNMKMLESKRYKDEQGKDEEAQNEKECLTERAKIKNVGMYNDIANTEYEHRFDNVTFKTLKKDAVIQDDERDKFTLDYY